MARKVHDRTPTMHGAVVIYWLMRGRKWTTSQWAKYLGLTNQGMLRIFNILSAEWEFAIAQNDDRQWVMYANGEEI